MRHDSAINLGDWGHCCGISIDSQQEEQGGSKEKFPFRKGVWNTQ